MAYPTLAVLKGELGLQDSFTDDDAKLSTILAAAIELAESYTGRSFNSTNATRQFRADDILTSDGNLHLPAEFLQLEQLFVNDQTWNYVDNPSHYVLLSADGQPPFNGVALSFRLPPAGNGIIGVRAEYGYCQVANIPFLVYRAIVLLAVHDYRLSLSSLRGVDLDRRLATSGTSEGMPDTVRVMLNQYRIYR